MKYIIIFLCLLLPCSLLAQPFIGLWKGTLYNDTTQLRLDFEIAVGKNNGSLTAFTLTRFIVNGKVLTGVKKVKATEIGQYLVLEDEDLLFNDYPVKPPKGVKQLTRLKMEKQNGEMKLTGRFITSRTRQYKPLTGSVDIKKTEDFSGDPLLQILGDLGLLNSLSFIDKPIQPDVALKKSDTLKPPPTIIEQLKERKVQNIKTVYFNTDSLLVEIYDNGYIDNDTVSLIVNGVVVLKNQRLSEKPVKTVLSSKKGIEDSLHVIIFAENLGEIAPNTGLLIIYDGNRRHEINFSGDLKNNQAVVLRRRE